MSGHEDPKPVGVDVLVTELVENQQRPEGIRSDKAIGSGEGSTKGKRKRPLGISPVKNAATVPASNKTEDNAALLKIFSLFSPTLRKNPASEAVAAVKVESQKAKPAAQEPPPGEKPVQSELETVLAPLVNAPRGQGRKQRPGDKLEPIDEDETLELRENYPDAPDIDSVHKGDPPFCSFYAKRIHDNYQRRERLFVVPGNYLDHQGEEIISGRVDIVDWMIQTHHHMRLKMETLFLSLSYMDRYLATKKIVKSEFHVLAATCLFMAGKYEEMLPPRTKDIIECMSLNTNKKSTKANFRDAMLVQERALFTVLEGFSALPTVYIFVLRYIMAAGYLDSHEVTSYCLFLSELSLYRPEMQSISPSKVAAAIVLAARIEMNEPDLYPVALWAHSRQSFKAVLPIAQELNQHAKNPTWRTHQGDVARFYSVKKYASAKRHRVSLQGLTKFAKKKNPDPEAPEPDADNQSRKIARVANGGKLRRE